MCKVQTNPSLSDRKIPICCTWDCRYPWCQRNATRRKAWFHWVLWM